MVAKGAADLLLAKLKDSILKHAEKCPQINFRSYMERRIHYKLDSSRLSALTGEEKANLAKDLRTELEQMKRISKLTSVYSGKNGDAYTTVLDTTQSEK
jgi:hypothetical protein